MNPPLLQTISHGLFVLASADECAAARDALNTLADSLLRAQAELSFYARNGADYANGDDDAIVERASRYLANDAGVGATTALALLGLEVLPPSPEDLARERGEA